MNWARASLAAISIDHAVLGAVAILGIYDGMRVLKLPVFVPEPLGSGSYLMGVSALLLLATGVEALLRPATPLNTNRAGSERVLSLFRAREVWAWLALILYAGLLEPIGYFSSTLCYLTISIRLFGERRWIWIIGIGGAFTIVFYVIFERLAGIPLP